MEAKINYASTINTLNNYDMAKRHSKMLCVVTKNGTQSLEVLDKSKLGFIEWIFFTLFKISPRNHVTSLKGIAKLIINTTKNKTAQNIQQNSIASKTTLEITQLIKRGKSTKKDSALISQIETIEKFIQASLKSSVPPEVPLPAPRQPIATHLDLSSPPKPTAVAQNESPSPMPPVTTSLTEKSILPQEGVIKNGFGEYLVYRMNSEGKKESIAPDEHNVIFEIIESARALKGEEFPENRNTYLKGKIQEKLGADVQIAFIPRSLYELIYLQECVQEDLNNKKCCNGAETRTTKLWENKTPENQLEIEKRLKNYFWQHCLFVDSDYTESLAPKGNVDCRQEYVKIVAAKLNEVALKRFSAQDENAEGFTFQDVQKVTDICIDFFKNLRDENSSNHSIALSIHELGHYPSIAKVFASEALRRQNGGTGMPLRVADERQIQIINKAIQLECSAEAINHHIFYRGSQHSQDTLERDGQQHSLSFGSLFGGASYDRGACAFQYMHNPRNNALAYVIPLNKLLEGKTPFTIPNVPPLIPIMSWGEYFHGRTLVGKENDPQEKARGFGFNSDMVISRLPSFCKTDQSREDLKHNFEKYKNRAHLLAN